MIMEHERDGYTICNKWARNNSKALVKWMNDLEIIGQIETIQITALLRWARVHRIILGTEGSLLSNISSEKPSAYAGVINSLKVKKKQQ